MFALTAEIQKCFSDAVEFSSMKSEVKECVRQKAGKRREPESRQDLRTPQIPSNKGVFDQLGGIHCIRKTIVMDAIA